MKKYFCVLCLILCSVCACTSDPAKNLPKGILPEEIMKPAYVDIFIWESDVQDQHLTNDSAKKLMQVHYEQIAMKYHTTTKELLNSMRYYSQHPQIYSETLQNVIDSLSALEARTN